MQHPSRALLLAVVAPLLLSACETTVVVHDRRPPPDRVEVIGVAPYHGAHWVRGRWVWHGRWVWVPGHWSRRAYYYY